MAVASTPQSNVQHRVLPEVRQPLQSARKESTPKPRESPAASSGSTLMRGLHAMLGGKTSDVAGTGSKESLTAKAETAALEIKEARQQPTVQPSDDRKGLPSSQSASVAAPKATAVATPPMPPPPPKRESASKLDSAVKAASGSAAKMPPPPPPLPPKGALAAVKVPSDSMPAPGGAGGKLPPPPPPPPKGSLARRAPGVAPKPAGGTAARPAPPPLPPKQKQTVVSLLASLRACELSACNCSSECSKIGHEVLCT